ncbi:protein ced-11 [Caerostris extrusa]|uniref:Protein ced-11 n=1 Tax=Caerostris extrusa TaxID=172846 RepID=A0AAV4VWH5_CAEEX|nr:protein ced-11 [Caerostris extrusa]
MSANNFPETALIGICRQDTLNFSEQFGVEQHFEEDEQQEHFLLNFANYLNDDAKFKENSETDGKEEGFSENKFEAPVMAVLFRGDIPQIDLILGYLRNELPVVIVEGSGGLSDLLAFAYRQVKCRPEGVNIAEYTETVLKPQIADKICQLEKNIPFSGPFVESVVQGQNFEREPEKDTRFARDLTDKYQVDAETMFRALTKPQRERFVDLFLKKGFIVHKFLNSAMLLNLFHHSLNQEFFKTVIWENVLGFGARVKLTRYFVDFTLTSLLKKLTGIPSLMNTYELDWRHRGLYDGLSLEEVEQKSVIALLLWGILSYRVELVKIIWKYSGISSTHSINLLTYTS